MCRAFSVIGTPHENLGKLLPAIFRDSGQPRGHARLAGYPQGFPRLARFKGTTPYSHFPRAKALRKVEIFRAAALGLQFLRAFIYY